MGPRPDGRGRSSTAWNCSSSRPSFNGAAAGWPRKAGTRQRSRCWAGSFNGAAAGWPRKACRVPSYAREVRASMGPRPDGRGRDVSALVQVAYGGLQWGRGRMAAEGGECVGGGGAECGLQWGRGRMAAEGRQSRRRPRARRCFNGAAAGWPRKDASIEHGLLVEFGFNGAAAGWPRKVRAWQINCKGKPASMGPRPDGRGRRPQRPAHSHPR